MELGYAYQVAVKVPELCKVELVGMNDLFQGFSMFSSVCANLSKIVPLDNTPSLLFHFSLALCSSYINFFQIVLRYVGGLGLLGTSLGFFY